VPRKTFVAGEILTALDVNTFLGDQAVMTFTDATERTAELPSPIEGMVTYLKDTDSLEKFDGTNFVSIAPPLTTANFPAGTIIDVKSALKTDAESFTSVASTANVAVTGLSITHALLSASNKLIISAYFGAASGQDQRGRVGLAVADNGTLINIADSASNRTRTTAGGHNHSTISDAVVMPAATFLYSPGDTASHTYTVRIINASSNVQNLRINRSESDADSALSARATSGLLIQEVAG
jgi:hypothetical protein